MWITDAPASRARRASAAYSSGVYGMAGHWSRLAATPLIAHVITHASMAAKPKRSDGEHAVLTPRALRLLRLRGREASGEDRSGLGRVDHVVDERPPGGD